ATVTAAPDSWFAAGTPPAPAPAFPDITAEIKNELAELKEAEALTPEEIEAFQEELARIEREADPAAPGETLDAVEAVREKLDTLLDIDAQAAKRLLPEQASFAALAANADSAEQLRKMLKESAAGRCARCGRHLGEGEGKCDGNCGGEEGEDGESGEEGDGPGRGGVSRGRGDAPLRFGEETQLGESERKDRAERAERIDTRPETQVGESIAAKDPSNNNLPITPGANRAIGGRNAGTTVQRTVLPRHRGTVKRFFDTERKQS
ncbi:MAG: hypothetical protein J6334_03290, partial [Kiritimatiellae bacterium]|nr:hypothetical protein [Kiritimatiellia bacterium]